MPDGYVKIYTSDITEKKFWLVDFLEANNIPYKIIFEQIFSEVFQGYWVEEKYEKSVLDFIGEYCEETEFSDYSFDDGFLETAEELDDISFSSEYDSISDIDVEKLLETADIPYIIKTDYEVHKAIKKLIKSLESDITDFIDYNGGRSVSGKKDVLINGIDFTVKVNISKNGNNEYYILNCYIIKE